MIVGSGNIARVLPESDKVFFASGVSNSAETRRHEFSREEDLLLMQDLGRHVVYFSSLSVFYKDSPYTQHKLLMERLVKENFPVYTIMRLGNLAWDANPRTLINYLRAHPEAEIRDEYRYIIEKDEFLHWVGLIPDWPCEMNVTGRRMKVQEVYDEYVA